MSFDAWGQRRNTGNWQGPPASLPTTTMDGFTSQEHFDQFGLIHYNGRVYDPGKGRFISADPMIDAGIQGLNRYSYVLNNPLSNTDPTGYLTTHQWGQIFTMAITMGGGAAMGAGMTVESAIYVGGNGFMAGAVQSGTLKGGAWGAFSALSFHAIGSYFDGAAWAKRGSHVFGTDYNLGGYAAKVLAHGTMGGVVQHLQGGQFGHGFASAGVSQALSGAVDGIDPANPTVGYTSRVMTSAMIGGVVSDLSGGKFAHGAMTAAFARAFNEEASYGARHRYRLGPTRMCWSDQAGCTRANAVLATDPVSVPFTDNPVEGRMEIGPMNDPIEHIVDRERFTIINITREGHTFHPGQVVHRLTVETRLSFTFGRGFHQREGVFLTTDGDGRNTGWAAATGNYVAGKVLFQRTHTVAPLLMRQYLKETP